MPQEKSELILSIWLMTYNTLKNAFSQEDTMKLQNTILPEVVTDVTETAQSRNSGSEIDFTSEDVRTSIGHVLLRKCGVAY